MRVDEVITDGAVAWEACSDSAVPAASWLRQPREVTNIAPSGPPIVRWEVPLRTTWCRVDAYVGAAGRSVLSEDALLVVEEAEGLTLAVADGVTPTPVTPCVENMNGARHAAITVLRHVRCRGEGKLAEAFAAANAALHRQFPTISDSRDRPQAAAVATHVAFGEPDAPTVGLVRAADCDVWTRRDGFWTLETTTDMLTTSVRAEIKKWMADHRDCSLAERFAMERTVICAPDCWEVTAVGRYDAPKFECDTVAPGFDDLVLVTDGAQVQQALAQGLSEPSQWLEALRRWEASNRAGYRLHDDVAMLHLTMRR
jgi:hypothetical protein